MTRRWQTWYSYVFIFFIRKRTIDEIRNAYFPQLFATANKTATSTWRFSKQELCWRNWRAAVYGAIKEASERNTHYKVRPPFPLKYVFLWLLTIAFHNNFQLLRKWFESNPLEYSAGLKTPTFSIWRLLKEEKLAFLRRGISQKCVPFSFPWFSLTKKGGLTRYKKREKKHTKARVGT